MPLREGKTKSILQSSIESALLAVEVYNKPRTPFKVENYISLMIIAWTKLFHAYFYHTIGDRYYYKEKNNRFKKVDGDKKAWELTKCISEFQKMNELSEPIAKNLQFFIKLRNIIEHRHIDEDNFGLKIFGECQSLLYNFEKTLVSIFGEEYALDANLAYSLQFSRIRTSEQKKAIKTVLSKNTRFFNDFILNFQKNLTDEVFNSQDFSIKLIQIPKISNNKRGDLAIEFINLNDLSDEDKESIEKIPALVKEKKILKEAKNVGKLRYQEVWTKVNENCLIEFNAHDLNCMNYVFSIKPFSKYGEKEPFETNTDFCFYDEPHRDYLYTEKYIEFLINLIASKKMEKDDWRSMYQDKIKNDINQYL